MTATRAIRATTCKPLYPRYSMRDAVRRHTVPARTLAPLSRTRSTRRCRSPPPTPPSPPPRPLRPFSAVYRPHRLKHAPAVFCGAAIPHCPLHIDRLPARRHRLHCLTTLRSKPAPVRHRATMWSTTGARSKCGGRSPSPTPPSSLPRPPARTAHPLGRCRPPLETSTSRAPRGGRSYHHIARFSPGLRACGAKS
ncbi:hypothetical protein DFH09DRAFT_1205419 [Mycena vulgaris]|nr:hypothetical protein DFH09DRAFT_1205419 [Mycena vulgaris]